MKIIDIETLKPYKNFLERDENGREINIFKLENVYTQEDIFYPKCLFLKDNNLINPSSERIMSLSSLKEDIYNKVEIKNIEQEILNPVFFLVYNTDNYYHFIYDTLPYLISFLELKKEIPELKLLMNFPNFAKNEFYKFVSEFLEIVDISSQDIIIISKNTKYSEVYISSSYTHGIDSNLPPREEIYSFYNYIVSTVKSKYSKNIQYPKKIYVSRRTWMNSDLSNIGTNYTTRRKLLCENELVSFLEENGFVEIFTENLSTIEKICMFDDAEIVVGPIGGGLCNVLFSNKNCRLISLCSPGFLKTNNRFKYCFSNIKTDYYSDTFHVETNFWKKWMRVKYQNIIGEIEDISDDSLMISYTENSVAGWNNEITFNKIKVKKEFCTALDEGLNSSWNLNLKNFKKNNLL
jgi:hypothetical protein